MVRVPRAVSLLFLALGALLSLWSAGARADDARPQGLHVLEIDSDSADEQADALTAAIRSRVRGSPGWVLLDTTQSLSMLTAALRCPARPDAGCLQRIGDQLKTDQFLWGVLFKAPPGNVTAEVHRWTRGKMDASATETYSDNLKDQNDDNLKRIAGRIFERLSGGPSATVVVHVSSTTAPGVPWLGPGSVVIDGNHSVVLDHGTATLFLPGGVHALDVQVRGFTNAQKSVQATLGTKQDVSFDLTPLEVAASPASGGGARRALMVSSLIAGGVLVATGIVLGVVFEVERSDLQTDLLDNYGTHKKSPIINDPCAPPAGLVAGPTNTISQGCSANNTASAVAAPEGIALGLGAALLGTGIILYVTQPKDSATAGAHGGLTNVRVLPELGPRGGALGLSASF